MGTFTKNTVSSGSIIYASDHNTLGDLIAAVLNGSVDSTNLADNAVTTTKITDLAVTEAKIANGALYRANGWVPGSGTWTYASASTVTVPASDAACMSVGTKIWLTQTSSKYFYVTGVSGTTITVNAGSDYTVANASITSPYFSNVSSPFGFPTQFNFAGAATGFSSTTVAIYRLSMVGNLVTLVCGVSGTSNGTGFTITAPITSKNTTSMFWQTALVVASNNGANLTAAGRAYIANNTTAVTIGKAPNDDTWTAANGKAAYFTLQYEI